MLTTSTVTESLRWKLARKPFHSSGILRCMSVETLGLNMTKLSEALGVFRKNLSGMVNERVGVTSDMALRLSRAFNTTPDP